MTRTYRVPADRVALAAGAVVWALACTTALAGCGGHTTAPVHRPAGVAAGSGPVTAPAGGAAVGATSAAPSAAAPSTSAPGGRAATTAAAVGTGRTTAAPAATGGPSTPARRTTASRTSASSSASTSGSGKGSGKGTGKGTGGGAGSAATTSAAGVVWPADVPFPAGTVQAHFDDPTDWSATLLAPGFQPDVHDRLTALYTGAGFTLVSDGLPEVLTRGRYTLRVQVSPRDHRENESYVTLQLSA